MQHLAASTHYPCLAPAWRGVFTNESTFIGEGEAELLPETDNPSLLFEEPDEVRVELRLEDGSEKLAKTFLIGQEEVSMDLRGTALRGGNRPAIAEDVTVQISKPDGTVVFSRSMGSVGAGFSSGAGGGWGRGTSWNQINADGSFAEPGSYWAGVILTNPTHPSAQEDYSERIIFTIIDPTPPNAPSEVMVDDSFVGTDDTHFKTIQSAIEAVAWNGTIHVAPGTYDEKVSVWKDVRILTDGTAAETIIMQTSDTFGVTTLDFLRVSNATVLDGFTIKAIGRLGSHAIRVFFGGSPVIQNNIIHGGSTIVTPPRGSSGINVSSGEPLIRNNTIVNVDNGASSYSVASFGGQANIVNNILVGDNSSQTAIEVANNTNPLHQNNYMYNHTEAGVALGAGDVITNAVPPGFVNSAAGDYHLAAGSPAIDAGTNTNAPSSDFEGDSRPFNGTVDMGADEFKP